MLPEWKPRNSGSILVRILRISCSTVGEKLTLENAAVMNMTQMDKMIGKKIKHIQNKTQ